MLICEIIAFVLCLVMRLLICFPVQHYFTNISLSHCSMSNDLQDKNVK